MSFMTCPLKKNKRCVYGSVYRGVGICAKIGVPYEHIDICPLMTNARRIKRIKDKFYNGFLDREFFKYDRNVR